MKAFLPHLIEWQRERGYPFEFSTEASINLADDDALLSLMRAANFCTVFAGIESPDTDTLVSTQKKQNTRRALVASVHKIYRAGMFVNAGFIVGFDSEQGSVAAAMVECIEATAIPFCMIGLLYALANTQFRLWMFRPAIRDCIGTRGQAAGRGPEQFAVPRRRRLSGRPCCRRMEGAFAARRQ